MRAELETALQVNRSAQNLSRRQALLTTVIVQENRRLEAVNADLLGIIDGFQARSVSESTTYNHENGAGCSGESCLVRLR